MQTDINLIPNKEKIVIKRSSLSVKLRIFSIIFSLAFFVSVLVMVGIITTQSFQIKNSLKKQDEMILAIKDLEKVEQQYVLVKDRVDKIKIAKESSDVYDDYKYFLSFYDDLSNYSDISSAQIKNNEVKTEFITYTYQDLTETLSRIVVYDLYNEIKMNSFSYTPDTGYSMSVDLMSSK